MPVVSQTVLPLSDNTQSTLLPVLFNGAYKYSFSIFEYVRSKDVAEQLSKQLPYLLAYSIGGMHSMLLK